MITEININVAEIRRIAAALKLDAEGYPTTTKIVYSASADRYSVVIEVVKDESLTVTIETEEADAGQAGEPTAAELTGE